MYDNRAVEEARSRSNTYDDPHYLSNAQHLQRTPAGVYDNPGEILTGLDDQRGVYDNREGVVGKSEDGRLYDNVAKDKPEDMPPTRVRRPPAGSQRSNTPKFDDTIYAVRRDNENGRAIPGRRGLKDLGEPITGSTHLAPCPPPSPLTGSTCDPLAPCPPPSPLTGSTCDPLAPCPPPSPLTGSTRDSLAPCPPPSPLTGSIRDSLAPCPLTNF